MSPRRTPQIQHSFSVSPDLDKAFQVAMKRRKMTKAEALREALAQWLGKPELAEMAAVGAPRKDGPETKG